MLAGKMVVNDHSLTGVVHDEDAIYVAVIAEDDVISTDTSEAGSRMDPPG